MALGMKTFPTSLAFCEGSLLVTNRIAGDTVALMWLQCNEYYSLYVDTMYVRPFDITTILSCHLKNITC